MKKEDENQLIFISGKGIKNLIGTELFSFKRNSSIPIKTFSFLHLKNF
jgi:hypothetical protein